jgi:hypothetical protein
MNRSAALSLILDEYSELATEAGIAQADSRQGFKGAIDNALRSLSYRESELGLADVPANRENSYVALLKLYALRRLSVPLATYADVRSDAPGQEKKKSQIFAQVQKLLALSQKEVDDLGLGTGGGFQLGSINLDYLEPEGDL